VWHCVGAGQVSLLLTVLAIAGLASGGQRGPAAVAAAAAFKLYPMLFAVPYAMRLRRDYLLRFALWLGGLAVLLPSVARQRAAAVAADLGDRQRSSAAALRRVAVRACAAAAPLPLGIDLRRAAASAVVHAALSGAGGGAATASALL
jgi:hypothetical protein